MQDTQIKERILLIVGGGIAAYKCLEVIRLLQKHERAVTVIMTTAACEFVSPLSFAALSGERVYTHLFDLVDETDMGHIELSRVADKILVAPATADLMAKMAHGLADDLASTCLLATDTPVLIAPAMNVRMWEHAATRRNLQTLLNDGVQVIGPNAGDMACGEFGPGRLAEPEEIVAALVVRRPGGTNEKAPLHGKRVLVTAGPTHEPIDPVRYIANRSSGKQGYAIAATLAARGAEVVLVSGPVSLPPPAGCVLHRVETADEMAAEVTGALPVDVAIFAAAVADWRVENRADEKLKKQGDTGLRDLKFAENTDILASVAGMPAQERPFLIIGFAAETENVIANATAKRARKGCDWIVANDVSPETGIMGGDENTVSLITEDDVETWVPMSKTQVADKLAARIVAALHGATSTDG